MMLRQPLWLWLWAAALVLALLAIMPLGTAVRVALALLVVCAAAWAWRRAIPAAGLEGIPDLPPAGYRQPVVLVCGDGLDDLFGVQAPASLALRTTAQGCYVRVADFEQLGPVTERLLSQRPEWAGRLSVMLVLNPGQHSDGERLGGRLQAFRHQLKVARRGASALPLALVSYLQASQGEGPWFSWHAGQSDASVLQAGACSSLTAWQRQGDHTARASQCVKVNAAAAWLGDVVLPGLLGRNTRESLGTALVYAVTWVPLLPGATANNLWQQWLGKKVGVFDAGRVEGPPMPLPFPDPLLHLLPAQGQPPAQRGALAMAVWLLALAGLVAMASSAWHNRQLLREASADLEVYTAMPAASPMRRAQALAALQQHGARLDSYYRNGAPLGLGFGLYRGERMRLPVLAVLGHQAPALAAAQVATPGAIRLDSLSLFNSGSAQLKPESTKVLVSALVGIKAQPGWLIVIGGHTDATGSSEHNLQLSRARAAAVRDWMAHMGDFHDSCFAVQGFGASQPIASNDSEDGRAANRRVDIRLVPEAGACVLATTGPGRQTLSQPATAID